MTGKTHLLFGVTAGLWLISQNETTIDNNLIILGLSGIGSLLPDIDNESTISNLLKPLSVLHNSIMKNFKCGAHRGITHSLLYAILLSSPFLALNPLYALATFSGLISHIILDLISGGVALLSPFYNKRITIAKIKTGSVLEGIVFMCLIVVFFSIVSALPAQPLTKLMDTLKKLTLRYT